MKSEISSIIRIIGNGSVSAENIVSKLKEEGYYFASLKWLNQSIKKHNDLFEREASSGNIRLKKRAAVSIR